MLTLNTLPHKVSVDLQPVWPPVSRYGFRIEDTGHMYMIRTPSHIQIQWLHSSGLMILEASKASKAQGRGLCGEVGPSWGGRGMLPGSTSAPRHRFPWNMESWDRVPGQRWAQQSCQGRDLTSCVLGLKLPAGRWHRAVALASCHFSRDCQLP